MHFFHELHGVQKYGETLSQMLICFSQSKLKRRAKKQKPCCIKYINANYQISYPNTIKVIICFL